ncbi:GMP synthase [Halieaceae bacterium IMCC14734]|uniref:GMP synthase n=1 Tax=Candidatus Litorirhabdus singularis TaxID=2518993 RepID=A0ABT3TC52_9GAMM|nr:GMP synthase [Candidatus Litorirhabdus singularis]MCX2979873.1 GMP synthase [Candidatus Litorirhabdus singularis]
MKIGILKTDSVRAELVDEFGEYPGMFQQLLRAVDPELEFIVFDVEAGEFPQQLDVADGWLITGSKSSVYEDKPWIHQLQQLVQRLHQERRKLVGICFGHQLVAQALGGATEKSSKGWGVGVHAATFSARPNWSDDDAMEFRLLVSHQDQVTQLPPEAKILAGSEFCENAVCQIGDHILTFQGHPEFVPAYSENLLNIRRDIIGEDNYRGGMASLSLPLDRGRVARWILNFLRA